MHGQTTLKTQFNILCFTFSLVRYTFFFHLNKSCARHEISKGNKGRVPLILNRRSNFIFTHFFIIVLCNLVASIYPYLNIYFIIIIRNSGLLCSQLCSLHGKFSAASGALSVLFICDYEPNKINYNLFIDSQIHFFVCDCYSGVFTAAHPLYLLRTYSTAYSLSYTVFFYI